MGGAAGTSTSSKPTNGKNKASNRFRNSEAGATSGVFKNSNDRFCLCIISFKQRWDCDESNSTETHQAWEPSSHSLNEGSFARIQAHSKKAEDVTIDEEKNIIIPRSYVMCGDKKHDVKSFQLDEKLKIIKISWTPSPRDEVEKTVDSVSHRVLRSAMPPDTPNGCQFSDQPNPYGPFIWNPKAAESPREDPNNQIPESTLSVHRGADDRFCLGEIPYKEDWDCDEANSTETHQAWQSSVHSLKKESIDRIKAHLKKSKKISIDKGRTIKVRSYVKCGSKEHGVTSFQVFEQRGIIRINWSPTSRDEVDESVEPLSPVSPTSTSRLASNVVLQAAMPSDTLIGRRQFLDPPNPHGRHFYWRQTQPAGPTREELVEQLQQQNNRISRLEEKITQLERAIRKDEGQNRLDRSASDDDSASQDGRRQSEKEHRTGRTARKRQLSDSDESDNGESGSKRSNGRKHRDLN